MSEICDVICGLAICCVYMDKAFNKCFKNAKLYPSMSESKACFALCLNLIPLFSGFGTLIAACSKNAQGYRCRIIMMGICQFLLTPLIVGWCWSVSYATRLHGQAYKKSRRDGLDKNQKQIDDVLA